MRNSNSPTNRIGCAIFSWRKRPRRFSASRVRSSSGDLGGTPSRSTRLSTGLGACREDLCHDSPWIAPQVSLASHLYQRGDNDSFMDKGPGHRYKLAIEGYDRLADTFFPRGSIEAQAIRRAVRDELSIRAF